MPPHRKLSTNMIRTRELLVGVLTARVEPPVVLFESTRRRRALNDTLHPSM